MHPIRRYAACILAVVVLSSAGCSRLYDFAGVVIDGDGNPIPNASFAINPHGWDAPGRFDPSSKSGPDGRFTVSWGNATGVEYFTFVTACEGFANDSRVVAADATDIRIVLARTHTGD